MNNDADEQSPAGDTSSTPGALESPALLRSQRELLKAEVVRLRDQLRDEQLRKDNFLAMLAHELRNPLAPLVTSLQVLRHGLVEPVAVGKQLDVMTRQVDQLSRLVEDLLDVSRVNRGRIELRRKPLALGDVLADALETSFPLIEARQHMVDFDVGTEPVAVFADAVRLTQVFANLLNNAAKYTDPGGRIALSCRREGELAVVDIEDTGIGIAPEMLPNIFDLFAQGAVSIDRAQGGLGIGLTLVRSLVESHGGSVSAHSEGVGLGSTLTVRLPVTRQALAPSMERPRPVAASTGQTTLRVLVVDDNEDAADSLAEILSFMGHEPTVAYSGMAALAVADQLDPQLVLLDIGLPQMDGFEVARRLRQSHGSKAWLVALTGYGSDADRKRSLEAGFDEHVVKPLMPETLTTLAERALASAADRFP